jgi:hypothetical protein
MNESRIIATQGDKWLKWVPYAQNKYWWIAPAF